jgi:hypothetical protein
MGNPQRPRGRCALVGFNEMDSPLCGSALMSHNGSRSRHNHGIVKLLRWKRA